MTSGSSTLLASAGEDAIIRIWDVETGEVIATFEGHEDEITDLDWSPDGRFIATASRDGTARIWQVEWPTDKNRAASRQLAYLSVYIVITHNTRVTDYN